MIEILVVITIMMVLMGLVAGGAMMVRTAASKRQASSTLDRLHIAMGTLLLEKPVPRDAATGNDGSGYLVHREIDTGTGQVRSVLQELLHRELFGYKPSEDCDQQDRLLDPWGQPYLFVVGTAADPGGQVPATVADERDEWQVVNAKAEPESRIYIYSYGRRNFGGSNHGRWIVHEVD